ncbi:uncharacterized protein [Malus domestica]|uniref:uncharacterized protein n=1 Tax=Malus domestica TaxID=3750 RepID=UPI003974FF10
MRGAIATKVNLFHRRCAPSPLFPICYDQEESIEHVLLLCPWVDHVWFGGALGLRIVKPAVTTLFAWLEGVWNNYPGHNEDRRKTLAYIAFTFWSIWKARCEVVFNSRQPSPERIILVVSMAASSFLEVCSDLGNTRIMVNERPNGSSGWFPPANGVVKMNVGLPVGRD